ncbi:MAG TPA: WD40 repeat domain-containing protein [Fimbriimonadaceae bacterium]|nr:WD40 repeat domain-containing protein [Fimbriimonadaceae bacterium]
MKARLTAGTLTLALFAAAIAFAFVVVRYGSTPTSVRLEHVSSIVYSAKQNAIFASTVKNLDGLDKHVVVYRLNADTLKIEGQISLDADYGLGIALSPDESLIAIGTMDSTILASTSNLSVVKIDPPLPGSALMGFAPDGKLVLCDSTGLFTFDVNAQKRSEPIAFKRNDTASSAFSSKANLMAAIDGMYKITTQADQLFALPFAHTPLDLGRQIHLFDGTTMKESSTLHLDGSTGCAFSPDGNYLAVVGNYDVTAGAYSANRLTLWNVPQNVLVWSVVLDVSSDRQRYGIISDVAFLGANLICANGSGDLLAIDLKTGRKLWTKRSGTEGMWAVSGGLAVSKDGKHVYTRSMNQVIKYDL